MKILQQFRSSKLFRLLIIIFLFTACMTSEHEMNDCKRTDVMFTDFSICLDNQFEIIEHWPVIGSLKIESQEPDGLEFIIFGHKFHENERREDWIANTQHGFSPTQNPIITTIVVNNMPGVMLSSGIETIPTVAIISSENQGFLMQMTQIGKNPEIAENQFYAILESLLLQEDHPRKAMLGDIVNIEGSGFSFQKLADYEVAIYDNGRKWIRMNRNILPDLYAPTVEIYINQIDNNLSQNDLGSFLTTDSGDSISINGLPGLTEKVSGSDFIIYNGVLLGTNELLLITVRGQKEQPIETRAIFFAIVESVNYEFGS